MKDNKIEWLEKVVQGLETLIKRETPGMHKRRLVGLKFQMNTMIQELKDEEKKVKTTR